MKIRCFFLLCCFADTCLCYFHYLERGLRPSSPLSGHSPRDVFHSEGLRDGMRYVQLANSSLVVSEICLGSMTWGKQNSFDEAKQQMDLAFDTYGVNFIDTAELYPVPTNENTLGQTHSAIGQWLKSRRRDQAILATKVTGRSEYDFLRKSPSVKGEGTRVRRKDIIHCVDVALTQLGTDYIDLLQIHWPDRYVPLFGSEAYNPAKELEDTEPIEDQLCAFDELIRAGKIRYIGLSNETPYGVCQFVELAKRLGLPRVVSIQNAYNLLIRGDVEIGGLLEACAQWNCDVPLLAYSPLAGGSLTGKYQVDGHDLSKARLELFPQYMTRYRNPICDKAVATYAKVAKMAGLTPTQLALAWCYTRPFIASTIIGATSTAQLEENLQAYNCPITDETFDAVSQVYCNFFDPTKNSAA